MDTELDAILQFVEGMEFCPDLDTHRCTARCNWCAHVVVPASTPFAMAPGLEISYRLRSHFGSTGSFTSGPSQYPGRERAALLQGCGELHVPG